MSETDIRALVPGLRPMADFRHAVERTITHLNTRALKGLVVRDEEDDIEREELEALAAFWSELLISLGGEVE